MVEYPNLRNRLPIYRYSPDSPIDEVEIVTNPLGGSRAYLHARPDAAPDMLGKTKAQLSQKGWVGVPYAREGKAVLEVRGFGKPAALHQFLQAEGLAENPSAPEATKHDVHTPMERFRSATLKWTGLAYIFGDAAFYAYALMERSKFKGEGKTASNIVASLKNKSHLSTKARGILTQAEKDIASSVDNMKGSTFKLLAGVGYAVGSFVLMGFGSKDQSELEIKNTTHEIDAFLKNEGYAPGVSGKVLTQQPDERKTGFFDRVHNFLRRYPSEALNIVYTGVGLLLMGASIKSAGVGIKSFETHSEFVKRVREDKLDIGLGAVTAVSAITGLVVKEKKPVKGEEKRTGLAGAWDWIQEKPLRATGYGYMLATAIHGIVTYSKWKKNPVTPADFKNNRIMTGRGIFVGLNVIAEALMVISSKGHGEGVKSPDVDRTVIATAAEFIAKQDPSARDALVERLSGYMASPDLIGGTATDIAGKLREQMAVTAHNPWLDAPETRVHSAKESGTVQPRTALSIANA